MNSPTRVLRLTEIALGVLLTAWAPAALALPANLTATVHLRAGPSVFYPAVALMPAGAPVQVFGCEIGYNWCDVQVGADRGWVDAAFLSAASPGGPVLISSGAVALGVPTVSFVFNTYWGTYYTGRPWYGRRNTYLNYWNRYPHGRPPPMYRPPVVRPPPPVRPPPTVRPPPRPPGNSRPPGNTRPPNPPPPTTRPTPPGAGRPTGNANPPPGGGSGSGNPSGGNRPQGGGRPQGGNRPQGGSTPQGGDRPPPSDDRPPRPNDGDRPPRASP